MSGIVSFCNKYINIENAVDEKEAFIRIEQEGLYTDNIDRTAFWGNFANDAAAMHSHFPYALTLFAKEGVHSGIALDLGCGRSNSTLQLLEKNWKVIAVDSSNEVLNKLKHVANQRNPDWLKTEKLQLVQTKLEDYEFPSDVTLILANRVLPYTDPRKFRELWEKIHASLAPEGRLVGSFIPRKFAFLEKGSRAFMGAWFTDLPSIRALLAYKKYTPEICEICGSLTASEIVVVAKNSLQPSKKTSFSFNFSSYYDAIRSLPSKKFTHILPYFFDKIVDLRELSKCVGAVSSIVTIAQLLLQTDPTASNLLLYSFCSWATLTRIAEVLEPRVKAHIRQLRAENYENTSELKAALEEIKSLQANEKISALLNPPPARNGEHPMMALLQQLGVPPEELQKVRIQMSQDAKR